jgi:hypothetical protein
MQQQKRQRSVDDFNRRYEKYFVNNDFDIGTWVLVHETWLDDQQGNKDAPRWSGPFVVHQKLSDHTYRLREIDGTVKRGKIAKDRLKIFYFREENQTVKSVSMTNPGRPYPMKLVPLDGPVRDTYWMEPYNINLIRYAIFRVGRREEGAKSMIGELDNLMGTADAEGCNLLDPELPYLLACLEDSQRKHNVADLVAMTNTFLNSSVATLN